MPKFSQNIYKSAKLEVAENQIDVVKKSLQGAESTPPLPPPMTNRVNREKCNLNYKSQIYEIEKAMA